MICNPQQRSMLFLLLGDYKSPSFNRSNLFLRRIANPPGRLAGFIYPQGVAWARSFWAFSPFLSHKRKFCDIKQKVD